MNKKKAPRRTAEKPDEYTDEYVEINPANEVSEDDFEFGATMAGYDDVEKFRDDSGGDPNWNPYDDADTQFNCGEHCREGKGVAQDYAQAADWYRKAARQNHAEAQSNLGVLYEKGLGVKKSYLQAATWYRKSAEQGEPTGQFNIGNAYEFGRGVPQDYRQAAGWYRKAAEQGHADAQLSLGYLCDQGLGVRKNHVDAFFWMSIAATEMKRKVLRKVERELELIATKLKPQQLSRATDRVKRHLAKPMKGVGMNRGKGGVAKAKRDGIKEAIHEVKLAIKGDATYIAVLKKEQVKTQKSLEKAERSLVRLKAKLDAAKGK